MKTSVYNWEGKEVEKIDLPKEIFGVEMNDDLIRQVVVSQMANRRQGSAHTKDRKDVRGGGKKPWRQKGTGRARHGSIRSPLWKGGGITFGPRNEKDYKKRIPEKMKRKALLMALSSKARDGELTIVESLSVENPKTKVAKDIIKNLPLKSGSSLILLLERNENMVLGIRNLPKIESLPLRNINALDALSFRNIIIAKDGVKAIEEILK